MRVDNPTEDDVRISSELEIKIKFSTNVNKNLSSTEKLEILDELEENILNKIKNLENVDKVIY